MLNERGLENEAQRSNIILIISRDAGVKAYDLLAWLKLLHCLVCTLEDFSDLLIVFPVDGKVKDVAPGFCSASMSCNLLDFDTRLDYELLPHAPVGVGNVELWALHTIG